MIMKLALIPGVITPKPKPIADAAIIRLNRDDIRNPPEIAFRIPNNLPHKTEGTTLMTNSVISKAMRNQISDWSNSARALGSNSTPTMIKKKGIKNPNPIPSNFTSKSERSRCNMEERTRPLKKAPSNTTSSPMYCEITTKIIIINMLPRILICEAACESW